MTIPLHLRSPMNRRSEMTGRSRSSYRRILYAMDAPRSETSSERQEGQILFFLLFFLPSKKERRYTQTEELLTNEFGAGAKQRGVRVQPKRTMSCVWPPCRPQRFQCESTEQPRTREGNDVTEGAQNGIKDGLPWIRLNVALHLRDRDNVPHYAERTPSSCPLQPAPAFDTVLEVGFPGERLDDRRLESVSRKFRWPFNW
ncbi:hypothetical protein DFH08DRAFT_253404 [Mycena albidolilacea]|uniref:Uncharacterized protein n=1 Tax=Mycena albidolilacea TaxID=1033008 RepID=A0AAD6ZSY7_9AGAR|nr:hypothetical protein DFH08DRAFT_253404 [Mycena albidolilacea]